MLQGRREQRRRTTLSPLERGSEQNALPPERSTFVGESLQLAVAVIRFGRLSEADGADRRPVLQEGSGDAMHSIHDPAVGSEEDRIARFDRVDQANVINDRANGRPVKFAVESVDAVDFADRVDRDVLDRQVG